MTRDDEREIRTFLKEAHRVLDPDPPSFEATLAAARRRDEQRTRPRRPGWRVAAAAAAMALTLVGLTLFGRPRSTGLDTAEALLLAESLSSWQGPTDFLGQPPGADLLETLPRLNQTTSLTNSSAVAVALAAREMEKAP